jgi:hypothetical protein
MPLDGGWRATVPAQYASKSIANGIPAENKAGEDIVGPVVSDVPTARSDVTNSEPAFHFVSKNGVFRFRIHDQSHATIVILLGIILLLTPIILLISVATPDRSWAGSAFDWMGKAFMLLLGVLVGAQIGGQKNP